MITPCFVHATPVSHCSIWPHDCLSKPDRTRTPQKKPSPPRTPLSLGGTHSTQWRNEQAIDPATQKVLQNTQLISTQQPSVSRSTHATNLYRNDSGIPVHSTQASMKHAACHFKASNGSSSFHILGSPSIQSTISICLLISHQYYPSALPPMQHVARLCQWWLPKPTTVAGLILKCSKSIGCANTGLLEDLSQEKN